MNSTWCFLSFKKCHCSLHEVEAGLELWIFWFNRFVEDRFIREEEFIEVVSDFYSFF